MDILGRQIRRASEPDNHGLIELWLQRQPYGQLNRSTYPLAGQRRHYEQQFRLLLDTALDELLPSHWREACLNHIYRPLFQLKRLASTERDRLHVQALQRELTITTRYFQPTFYFYQDDRDDT